ncbi:MAG: 16S rRNA (guanine(527)-N(7))-methyltransferase RsmG [Betaproteobacteria bacterium]|nr:16S rRNA (guanine(527)-N(7))-methyltransferase RsmG [Betaproteobacteria bacterium]
MSPAEELEQGIAALGLTVPPEAGQRLLRYVDLLEKWNRVYNLTAIRDPRRMLPYHILDSLAVAPHVTGSRLLDVGAGAGLPGIPLAIARPALAVTLLDASHKKTAFLQQAVIELSLSRVDVVCARVEQWSATPYDCIVSRAFSDLAEGVRLARHLLAPGGRLLAMKGVYPYEELAQLPADVVAVEVQPLTVPGIEGSRHVVVMQVKSDG